jgi:hypothetical protein
MRLTLLPLLPLLVLVATPLPAADPGVEQLAWLAGDWVGTLGEAQVEEMWLPPAGGAMLGLGRTIAGSRQVEFELLRLVAGTDGLEYLASPDGRCPPTPFHLVEAAGQRVVFANPAHDFPKRITYWREGDTLHARVEGVEDGKPRLLDLTWHLRAPCPNR